MNECTFVLGVYQIWVPAWLRLSSLEDEKEELMIMYRVILYTAKVWVSCVPTGLVSGVG